MILDELGKCLGISFHCDGLSTQGESAGDKIGSEHGKVFEGHA